MAHDRALKKNKLSCFATDRKKTRIITTLSKKKVVFEILQLNLNQFGGQRKRVAKNMKWDITAVLVSSSSNHLRRMNQPK